MDENNLAVAAASFGNLLRHHEINVDVRSGRISWRKLQIVVPPEASIEKCDTLIKRFIRGAESWAERNGLGEQTNIFDAIGDYHG